MKNLQIHDRHEKAVQQLTTIQFFLDCGHQFSLSCWGPWTAQPKL